MDKKPKSKFVIKFTNFMINALSGGSYVVGELMAGLGSISYKGVRYSNHPYYRGIKNLEKRGLLTLKKDKIKMTSRGQKWLELSYLRYMRSVYPKWDGKWRVIIFDIPQELHNTRNLFRHRLKTLGFVTLQKSVYVFPYPCEEELGDLCRNYNISDYVSIIIADSIGVHQDEIKRHFDV